MKSPILILLLSVSATTLFAQKDRSQRCYRAKKDKMVYTLPLKPRFELQLGLKKSFLFSNRNGDLGSAYRFISAFRPYTGCNYHLPLGKNIGVYAGLQLSQNKQGLEFRHKENGEHFVEKHLETANLVRIPVGLTYQVNRTFRISAAPVITYFNAWEVNTTGTGSAPPSTSVIGYEYEWKEKEFYNMWFAGLDISCQAKISGRLSFDAVFSLDLKPSTPVSGTVAIYYDDGSEKVSTATLHPQLYYLGVGLSYSLAAKDQ